MVSVSFTSESIPKTRIQISANVVFIHTSSYSDIANFLQIYPEFVQYGNERVVKSVYDPGFPGIVMNFITDDISTYTLVKKQYVNGGHITRMYTAKQETPSCSNTQRPIMKSGEVLTEGTRPSMNSDIPVTENKEKWIK